MLSRNVTFIFRAAAHRRRLGLVVAQVRDRPSLAFADLAVHLLAGTSLDTPAARLHVVHGRRDVRGHLPLNVVADVAEEQLGIIGKRVVGPESAGRVAGEDPVKIAGARRVVLVRRHAIFILCLQLHVAPPDQDVRSI